MEQSATFLAELALPARETDFGPCFIADVVAKVIVSVAANLSAGVAVVELVTDDSVLVEEVYLGSLYPLFHPGRRGTEPVCHNVS